MPIYAPEKCRAKNPARCRKHGIRAGLSFDAFFGDKLAELTKQPLPERMKPQPIGLEARDYEHKYRDGILQDIETNRNLKIDPVTGEKTVSIFRSGAPNPPAERGVEKNSYKYADELAPEGRQGRTTGIFATANIDSALRWYHANSRDWSKITDYSVREIRVNPDTTYIYCVSNWERASSRVRDKADHPELESNYKPAMEKYWAESMTLTDWYQYVRENPNMDTRDWEVVIGENDIKQVKPVSGKRLLETCVRKDDLKELEQTIKNEARTRRIAKQVAAERAAGKI